MTRRNVLYLSLFLWSCSKPGRNVQGLLPEQIAGWKRGDVQSPADLPAAASSAAVVSSAQALYLGEGRVRVRVIELKAETVAFELMQKWRQTDGLAVYRGPYFFIAEGQEGASQAGVMQLLSALQKAAT